MIRTTVTCDVCSKFSINLDEGVDLKSYTWGGNFVIQESEFGHICTFCSQAIAEAEAMGESATFETKDITQIYQAVKEDESLKDETLPSIRTVGTLSANDVAVVVKDILKDE